MSTSNQIRIVGKAINVVEHDGLTIREAIGNVSTKNDDISLAIVSITEPTSEPWLTIDYDEWMHVTEGQIEIYYDEQSNGSKSMMKVDCGQTVFIAKGTRFQPVFPVGNTKYIPVCLPAFTPERCHREEEGVSEVSKTLNELHSNGDDQKEKPSKEEVNAKFNHITKIYHMCQKSLWEDATSSQTKAYFPPTFHSDGKFTHATAVPARLITTANHFYTGTKGEWICLELDRVELEKLGIVTVFEEAMPVGETATGSNWEEWVCPHIYGGIPGHIDGVVTNTFKMARSEDGAFLSISGLTE